MGGLFRRRTFFLIGLLFLVILPLGSLLFVAWNPALLGKGGGLFLAAMLLTLLLCMGFGLVILLRSAERFEDPARTDGKGKEISFLYDSLSGIITRLHNQSQDMEELNRTLEQRIQDKTEQLLQSEKLAAVGEMAAGLAHEMNNVLMPIRGYAKMIARKASGEEVRNMAAAIVDGSQDGIDLLRRLLTFSRKEKPRRERVGLARLARRAAELLRIRIEEKNARIEVRQTAPAVVKADSAQIEQVIVNLLLNAVDSLEDGGEVTLTTGPAEGRPGYAELSVTDTGRGMAPETLTEVFQPFFTTKGVSGGTGLGLSVTYGIVKEHGGTIEVDSKEGEGSRFRVFIPMPSEEK